jgi:hypothetical protein
MGAAMGVSPATASAALDKLVGTSTPAEDVPVIAFDSAATEYMDFYCSLPLHYAGGGVTLTFCWGAAATTGGVTWEAAFRRVESDAEDLNTIAFTYDFNSLDVAAPASASGEFLYSALTFTNGADMDSVAAGEDFILRVRRKHDDSNDTLSGDAWLLSVNIKET